MKIKNVVSVRNIIISIICGNIVLLITAFVDLFFNRVLNAIFWILVLINSNILFLIFLLVIMYFIKKIDIELPIEIKE